MYLVDALGRSGLQYVCCHHEQAASIAAQANAMYANRLGVCLSTTGPGGTNALTGCAAAYVDSTPVLFLSGQVKTADFASLRKVRQFGAQENNIVAMAQPVVKYAVLVEKPQDALFELQKSIFIATHGRQGPVWVDIPLDVQSAEVEENDLRRFDPTVDLKNTPHEALACRETATDAAVDMAVRRTLELLRTAKRPLVLAGQGVIAANAQAALRSLVRRLGVPLVSTWRALEILGSDDPLFFGSPGLQAVRSANIITQGSDFLLVLGSRLDNMITAFSEPRFAQQAQKIVVDIDGNEIAKLAMTNVTPVVCDVAAFLERLNSALPAQPSVDYAGWRGFCEKMKARFPLLEEKQDKPSPLVDLYKIAAQIGSATARDDVLVVSSTSRCNTAGHIALSRKEGQRSISSMGMGAMGFALPSVVGGWFASGGKRVIMLEGDGSLQLNIQELQTIRHYGVNAKLFVFCNSGYAAIATMQDRNFAGFHVGSDEGSGVSMPSLEKIAEAYGFSFVRISTNDEIANGVDAVMAAEGAVLCEIVADMGFDEIPKCISSLTPEGKRVSAHLENPYPFLPAEELSAIYTELDDATKG